MITVCLFFTAYGHIFWSLTTTTGEQTFVPKVPFLTKHLLKWKSPAQVLPPGSLLWLIMKTNFRLHNMFLVYQGNYVTNSHVISLPYLIPSFPRLLKHWTRDMWLSLYLGTLESWLSSPPRVNSEASCCNGSITKKPESSKSFLEKPLPTNTEYWLSKRPTIVRPTHEMGRFACCRNWHQRLWLIQWQKEWTCFGFAPKRHISSTGNKEWC